MLLQNLTEADIARLLQANPNGFMNAPTQEPNMMMELMKVAGQSNTGLMPVGGSATNADAELFNSLVKSNPYGLEYNSESMMFIDPEGNPMTAEGYQSIIDDINRQQQDIYNRRDGGLLGK